MSYQNAGATRRRTESQAPDLERLSSEQRNVIEAVLQGQDVIVDATVGSGKTATIQALCHVLAREPDEPKVLYLTFSKLLKDEAIQKVRDATVQNYHGLAFSCLRDHGIKSGVNELVHKFNEHFEQMREDFEDYDVLLVDEYQDLTEEYATMLENIASANPMLQVVMVGDLEQKIYAHTTLDVQAFARAFCPEAKMMPFTQSFRIGPQMAELLSEAWGKPITGVNTEQKVETMSFHQAMRQMAQVDPGDLLCLGTRKGQMSQALNALESEHREVFNKNTVYASIRDSDSRPQYKPGTAVFTTFDSAKGMERPVVFVFDYHLSNWGFRVKVPNADPEVLRNVFLVAASRGKQRVIFVEPAKTGFPVKLPAPTQKALGFIPVDTFTHLPSVGPVHFEEPVAVSGAFDFKFAEHVRACYDLLELTRLDDGTAKRYTLQGNDGLIDLSPVIGNYQEALFFESFDPELAYSDAKDTVIKAEVSDAHKFGADVWQDCLMLTAVENDHRRYIAQVDAKPQERASLRLCRRMAELLSPDDQTQIESNVLGTLVNSTTQGSTPITFAGRADVRSGADGMLYELKYVSEIDTPMFLQLAMYLIAHDESEGVLWNTQTSERWSVRIPDQQAFLNAVARAVSKGDYDVFVAD